MNNKKSHKIHSLIVVRHPVGGIRTFLRYVYNLFDKQIHKFTFVLPKTSELEALRENMKETDCVFVALPHDAGMVVFTKALFRILRQHNIDIIHSHGFTSMFYSILPACFFRKPHLLTSHDVFTAKQFSGLRGLSKKVVLDICFKLVDKIHSVSHDAQDNLLSYFPNLHKERSKLVVITNGIEIKRFFIEEQVDWRKSIGLTESTFLIGFFGRFMAQKGFKFLVDAIEIILKMNNYNVKPAVLAFGWGGFIREEQAELRERNLQTYFHFLPFQENPACAIKGTDVVVIPSLWEACPLLPMEVLLAGTPLIASNCIGMREILQDTPAKLVPVADGQALAHAISDEMRSPSKARIKRFRKEAIARFDVQERARELQDLITNMSR